MEETGLKEGDMIEVKLVAKDQKTGKLKLSRKVLLPKPEGWVEREPREPRERKPREGEQKREHRGPRRDHK
jgi:polyribonucleotide nucleotidyltransferase